MFEIGHTYVIQTFLGQPPVCTGCTVMLFAPRPDWDAADPYRTYVRAARYYPPELAPKVTEPISLAVAASEYEAIIKAYEEGNHEH